MMDPPTQLKRGIGLYGMVFLGAGTMVGAGFYALLGKIVAQAGTFTPLSLFLAGALALITAFSFAELSRRYPVSAGVVQFVDAAFAQSWLSQIVGALLILTGLVSSATLCVAIGGFLLDLTSAPLTGLIALTACLLTGIAAWGVSQSVFVIAVITLLEVGTLLVIVILSGQSGATLTSAMGDMLSQWGQVNESAIVGATFLAFYAFIGFEDMVSMAEETRDAEKTLPRAIFISVSIVVVLYIAVGLVAIGLPDREAFSRSNTPLVLLLPDWRYTAVTVGVIAILAGFNGALVQLMMAARVLYGMAGKGMAPGVLARVNHVTQTPVVATLLAGLLILLLATSFPITVLAASTSTIILLVFAMVNLSLAVLHWREGEAPLVAPGFWLPLLATASCIAMLLARFLI